MKAKLGNLETSFFLLSGLLSGLLSAGLLSRRRSLLLLLGTCAQFSQQQQPDQPGPPKKVMAHFQSVVRVVVKTTLKVKAKRARLDETQMKA